MSDTPSTLESLPDILEGAVAEALTEPVVAPPVLEFTQTESNSPMQDASPEQDVSPEQDASPKPSTSRRSVQLVTGAAVSFSLTLLAGSYAVLSGSVPLRINAIERVDIGAMLLFAPVCALVLALLFEATRLALKGPLEMAEPRAIPIDWSPGHREG
ncbi:MAG: hypothetical protein ABIO40_04005 [Devosia sp.]